MLVFSSAICSEPALDEAVPSQPMGITEGVRVSLGKLVLKNEMEGGVINGLYRDPSIQLIPTLGLKSVNITRMGLFGFVGCGLLHLVSPCSRPILF